MRIIGLAGWSGSGKTTLVTRVIPVLVRRGLKVATVKHAHHEFDTDQPGKDSWLHRQAGASEDEAVFRENLKRVAGSAKPKETKRSDLAGEGYKGHGRAGEGH